VVVADIAATVPGPASPVKPNASAGADLPRRRPRTGRRRPWCRRLAPRRPDRARRV